MFYHISIILTIIFILVNNVHPYIIITENTTIKTNTYQVNLLPYQIIELNFITNFAYLKLSNDGCINHKLFKEDEYITDDVNYYYYNYASYIPEIFKTIYNYKLLINNPIPLNKSIILTLIINDNEGRPSALIGSFLPIVTVSIMLSMALCFIYLNRCCQNKSNRAKSDEYHKV